MQPSRKMILGHLIRWLFILLSCFIVYSTLFSHYFFRVEKAAQNALTMMELPYAPITMKSETGHGHEVLQIVDRKNAMHHQLFVKRTLGIFWSYRGGGTGSMLDPQIILNFQYGYSTVGKYQHEHAAGQLNDPKISRLHIVWWDGDEQDALIKDGVYLATRSIRISNKDRPASTRNKLIAYDANGQLLYELNDEQREIRTETKT